jgi:hypothetical protein
MTETSPPAAPQQPEQHPTAAHDDHDINLRAVLGFGVAIAAILAGALLLVAWFFTGLLHWQDREKRSQFPLAAQDRGQLPQTTFGSPVAGQMPAGPRLEGFNLANPQHDIGRERQAGTAADKNAHEEAELNGRGTPDKPHIPITEAMRLVAEGYNPQGGPAPVRFDAGIPGTGGGSNSGRDIPEGKR